MNRFKQHWLTVPAALACATLAPTAHALTVSVGSSGCTHTTLQAAIDYLNGETGPHWIKLKTGSHAIANGATLTTTSANYTLIGGHASCGDTNPTAGQRSTLNATGGNPGTALVILSSATSGTPRVELRNISLTGGDSETGPFANPEGGGAEVRGKIDFVLNNSDVYGNASGKGAGVYLRGNSATQQAALFINGKSAIYDNVALTRGGGIYCDDFGVVYHDDGQVSYNQAESGAGADLRGSCRYDAIVPSGAFTGFVGNQATGNGGALKVYGSGDVKMSGAANAPFWFLDNVSSEGTLWVQNSGSTRVNDLLSSVVFKNNHANARLGAAMLVAGAIDLTMSPRAGATTCSFYGVGFGACSAIIENTSGTYALGGIVHGAAAYGNAPTLTLRRTSFIDNAGFAMIDWWGAGTLDAEQLLVTRNALRSATPTSRPAALIHVDRQDQTAGSISLKHSTFTGNSSSSTGSAILIHDTAAANVTGSLLYNPGLYGRINSSGALSHSGCLLVHDSAGFPNTPNPPRVGDPQLPTSMTPPASSIALDACSSSGAPSVDFAGRTRAVDQPAIANLHGPVDLGAFERPADPAPSAPNLRVLGNGSYIADGSTSTSASNHTYFGQIGIDGGALTRSFTLQNNGNATLAISGHGVSGTCSGNFAVGSFPATLAAGAQATVTLSFDPAVAVDCTVTYEIHSNDADNSPYNFRLRGVGLGNAIFANSFE